MCDGTLQAGCSNVSSHVSSAVVMVGMFSIISFARTHPKDPAFLWEFPVMQLYQLEEAVFNDR